MIIEKNDLFPQSNRNNFNNKGQYHGYWELINDDGSILFEGYFINGNRVGLFTEYYTGKPIKIYYIQ